ncbi:MAG: NADP-dependent oxidoreductase [Deltaproteobacteria bacterium]|nr:NADP-dependent oxidoreductase [Deltaproteobacteria bacterium]
MVDDNRQWLLRRRPTGPLTEDVFELRRTAVPVPSEGQVLVRTLCLSLDPANRVWIMGPSYRPAVEVGAVMDGFALGQVVRSEHPGFTAGDWVSGDLGWQDYRLASGRALRRFVRQPGVPLSYHLGVLGMTGLTAYFGLLDIGRPEPGQTVLVSGAAGATGSVAGQIAKARGCRVVGIAGSPTKCGLLVDGLGYDAAINYREDDVKAAIARHCPDGVDVYFDNVGGSILGAALLSMNIGGRIICCGAISGYDSGEPLPSPPGIPSLLIGKRLEMKGFIVLDYAARFGEGIAALTGWVNDGSIVVREDRVDGLEQAPQGLIGLLAGENVGKRWVHIAEPEGPQAS